MIKFNENILYGFHELETMLRGIVELPTLLDRLKLRENRVFRDALWGWEIIEASRQAPSYGQIASTQNHVVVLTPKTQQRASIGIRNKSAIAKLSAKELL